MRVLLLSVALLAPAAALAQASEGIVLVVDAGRTRLNVARLTRTLAERIERPLLRMTDEAAREAPGRLTIAFSRPDRWVLRYECHGAVAWVSDRIAEARRMQPRLVSLAIDLVARVDGSSRVESARRWESGDVILALQNEIVDPFAGEPLPPPPEDPIPVLWSEVVDPFRDEPRPRRQRPTPTDLYSEVLDPWSTEAPQGRRPR
jgi:hypothetical protein